MCIGCNYLYFFIAGHAQLRFASVFSKFFEFGDICAVIKNLKLDLFLIIVLTLAISERYQTGIYTFFPVNNYFNKIVESVAEEEKKAGDFFSMQLTSFQLYSLYVRFQVAPPWPGGKSIAFVCAIIEKKSSEKNELLVLRLFAQVLSAKLSQRILLEM